MNSLKRRESRWQKRHDRQAWQKTAYREIIEEIEKPREHREEIPKRPQVSTAAS